MLRTKVHSYMYTLWVFGSPANIWILRLLQKTKCGPKCSLICTHCDFLGPQWIFEFCDYYRKQNVEQLFVRCILLHPANFRTWKVPAAIECLYLCTRIHAWMCMYKCTSAEKNSHLYVASQLLPVSLLLCVFFGKVFVFECVCVCVQLLSSRALRNYCVNVASHSLPPPCMCGASKDQNATKSNCCLNHMLHKRSCQFGIEYVLLYCCILYWMHITEETDHYHATSTVGLR